MRIPKSLYVLLAAATMVCSANAANITRGLAAYWTLDDGSIATGIGGVTDSVGTANGTIVAGDGTVTTGIDGIVAQGVRFTSSSGVRPQINIGSGNSATSALSATNGSFSISLWFNLTNTTAHQTLLSFGNASSFAQGVSLIVDGRNGVTVRAYKGSDGNSRIGLTKGGELTANTWYNLVVVFNQNSGIVVGYLNGLGSGTTGSPTAGVVLHNGWTTGGSGGVTNMITGNDVSFGTSSLDLIYGTNSAAGAPMFGAVDELAIWNRALTQREVELLYESQSAGKGILEIPEPASVAAVCAILVFALAAVAKRRRRLR